MNYTEESKKAMAKIEAPNDEFFTHDLVDELVETARVRISYDFNTALGDTIREKYESMYVKLHELTNSLIKSGAKGYFWVVTSPEVASIFETATYGFTPCSSEDYYKSFGRGEGDKYYGQLPMGISSISFIGVLNAKWRMYKDTDIEANIALVGAGFSKKPTSHYGVLRVENYII